MTILSGKPSNSQTILTSPSSVSMQLSSEMNPSTGSGGTCYGDSGGPHFLGDTDMVVSLTVTGDAWCRATDVTYRLDVVSLVFWLSPARATGDAKGQELMRRLESMIDELHASIIRDVESVDEPAPSWPGL